MSFFSNLFSRSRGKAESNTSDVPHSISPVITSAEKLALLTIMAADRILSRKDCSYLNKSEYTKADTLIFSCFVIRALGIMAASNREKAVLFSNSFVSSFNALAIEKFALQDSYLENFDDRTTFYDRIFTQKSADEKFPAVVEEFEYIIKSDILQNKFADFSESSPLPILGFPEDMLCQAEVTSYFRFLITATHEFLKKAQSELR